MSSNSPKKSASKAKATTPKAPSQSKLIKRAHSALEKALDHHTEVAAASGVSLKRAQRSAAKLAAAAAAYAEAVKAKTGLESPFVASNSTLDGDTIKSLESERDAIEQVVTGSVPTVETPEPEPVAAAPKAPARRATTPRATASSRTTSTKTPTTRATTPRATGTRRTTSSIDTPTAVPKPATRRRTTAPKPPAAD